MKTKGQFALEYAFGAIIVIALAFSLYAVLSPNGKRFLPKPMISQETIQRAKEHGVNGYDLIEVGIVKLLDKIDRLEAECY